jgi:hypothetical protein
MFDIEDDIEAPDYYIETIPLITMEMEIKLDKIINDLAVAWGFASTKEFATSIIEDTLEPDRLVIYNQEISKIIDEARRNI